jgi:hypothetical protein
MIYLEFQVGPLTILTSSENLPVGPHQITVTVYDTYGNSNTISFYVIVSSVAAGVVSVPLAVMIMLEILGGVLILLSCVFVMAKRHGIAELPDIGDGLTGHFLKMQSELLGFSRRRFI